MLQIKLGLAAKAAKVSSVSGLRFNNNGYPYVTLITNDGKANNVYFGIRSAEIIEDDNMAEGDRLDSMLAKASLVDVVNEGKEQRFKISLQGISDYESAASIFGYEEEQGEFDMKRFIGEFAAKEVTSTNAEDLGGGTTPPPATQPLPPAAKPARAPRVKKTA